MNALLHCSKLNIIAIHLIKHLCRNVITVIIHRTDTVAVQYNPAK